MVKRLILSLLRLKPLQKIRLWVALNVVFLTIGGVVAADILQDYDCNIPADQVIQGNLFVLCRDLIVAGRVEGNLIGAAYTAEITGEITHNLYLLGGEVKMRGTLGSDLHFMGITLDIQPPAQLMQGDVLSLSLNTTIHPQVTIPGHVIGVGYQLLINGEVGQEVDFWGSALQISGTVNGAIDASVSDSQAQDAAAQLQTILIPLQFDLDLINPGLIVTDSAVLGSSLKYRGVREGVIQGRLSQPPEYIPTIVESTLIDLVEEQDTATALNLYTSQVMREFTTLGFIGLLGLLFIPEAVQRPIRTLRRQPWTSLGLGLLTFILSFPIVVIILILSVTLILLFALLRLDGVIVAAGIILGLVNIGGTSLFYFVALYVSRMVMGVAVGRLIVSRFSPINSTRAWFISLFLGIGLLAVFVSLPQPIGLTLNALALFLGLGAILTVLQAELRDWRDQTSQAAPVYYPSGYTSGVVTVSLPSSTQKPNKPTKLPPPMLEERVNPPGLDNLPEGFSFDWWYKD